MKRFTEEFESICVAASHLAKAVKASALLVLAEGPTDWEHLKAIADDVPLLVAADRKEEVKGTEELGIKTVLLSMGDAPVYEKLTQALLECVADDFVAPGSRVVAIYSSLEPHEIDSISVIDLGDHLGRLTARDLQKLETRVPLDTLKMVVDLALAIGREGREGKPVGTLFVVGDTRKVLENSRPANFDPFRGYSRKERRLEDSKVREAIKEIAQMDGAFIVSADGTVESAARILNGSTADITLSKGLGSRHWAAAAISKVTKAVAVAVSQSSGTVRIFENGELILRIEPFRRPMKWKGLELDAPPSES